MNKYESFVKKFDADRILEKTVGLREQDKDFLRALSEEAMIYQGDFFRHIEQYAVDSLSHGAGGCLISTIVLKKGELIPDGFFAVNDENGEYGDIVFAEREAGELPQQMFCNAIIDGKEERELKLVRTDILVKGEKKLSRIFKDYNISLPYAYSPYSRRAYVIMDSELDEKRSSIEFRDRDLFIGNMYRNVQFLPASKLSRYTEVTVNGQRFFRFRNMDENSFMTADGYDADICFFKRSGEQCIDILAEDHDTLDINVSKAQIMTVSPNIRGQFTNSVRNDVIVPVRIRTKADIVLAVKKYYQYPEEYADCSTSSNGCTIKDYPHGYKYDYSGGLSIGLANKNYCYLRFVKKYDDIFFEDRVNYFIAFMRYNYPEFYWVGVR